MCSDIPQRWRSETHASGILTSPGCRDWRSGPQAAGRLQAGAWASASPEGLSQAGRRPAQRSGVSGQRVPARSICLEADKTEGRAMSRRPEVWERVEGTGSRRDGTTWGGAGAGTRTGVRPSGCRQRGGPAERGACSPAGARGAREPSSAAPMQTINLQGLSACPTPPAFQTAVQTFGAIGSDC